MKAIEVLEAELVEAQRRRDILRTEDDYARAAHSRAQARFSAAVDEVKDLTQAIEKLNDEL